jgi:hypothetical protein
VTDLPEAMLAYFANRETERRNAVTAALAGLTDRERGLVRDAAVMGFVQGSRWRGDEDAFPLDRPIVEGVIDACLHMRDLYPTLSQARPPLPYCQQCGRIGNRGFRTFPANPETGAPAITVCANTTACAKRWPKPKESTP